jgi:hypothetical protein
VTGQLNRSGYKGKRGEREVVTQFRLHGFPKAARTPGSGSLRPYGAGDASPWPGDIYGVEPYLVEVKYDEKVEAGGVRSWPGRGFIQGVLRDLDKLANRKIIGKPSPIPVLFARANFHPWRVWVRDDWMGVDVVRSEPPGWIEITPYTFFSAIERTAPDASGAPEGP